MAHSQPLKHQSATMPPADTSSPVRPSEGVNGLRGSLFMPSDAVNVVAAHPAQLTDSSSPPVLEPSPAPPLGGSMQARDNIHNPPATHVSLKSPACREPISGVAVDSAGRCWQGADAPDGLIRSHGFRNIPTAHPDGNGHSKDWRTPSPRRNGGGHNCEPPSVAGRRNTATTASGIHTVANSMVQKECNSPPPRAAHHAHDEHHARPNHQHQEPSLAQKLPSGMPTSSAAGAAQETGDRDVKHCSRERHSHSRSRSRDRARKDSSSMADGKYDGSRHDGRSSGSRSDGRNDIRERHSKGGSGDRARDNHPHPSSDRRHHHHIPHTRSEQRDSGGSVGGGSKRCGADSPPRKRLSTDSPPHAQSTAHRQHTQQLTHDKHNSSGGPKLSLPGGAAAAAGAALGCGGAAGSEEKVAAPLAPMGYASSGSKSHVSGGGASGRREAAAGSKRTDAPSVGVKRSLCSFSDELHPSADKDDAAAAGGKAGRDPSTAATAVTAAASLSLSEVTARRFQRERELSKRHQPTTGSNGNVPVVIVHSTALHDPAGHPPPFFSGIRPSGNGLANGSGRHAHGSANGGGGAHAHPSLGGYVHGRGGMLIRDDIGDEEAACSDEDGHKVLGRVIFGVAQARCARPYMEDRHTIVSCLKALSPAGLPLPDDGVERSLAAVYDGHNGSRAAEAAASRLHMLLAADPALRIHTGEAGPPSSVAAEERAIGAAFKKAFHAVDLEILGAARREGHRDGATALVVLRLGDVLYTAHAGDSRAVLCRRGGLALRLTHDHKPNHSAELARIEWLGGRIAFASCWRVVVEPRDGRPGSGLAVSRALGDLDFKEPRRFVECEPDVSRVVVRPGDAFVLLASDGLYDVLSDEEAVRCVWDKLQAAGKSGRALNEADAKAAAEAVLALSVARGTTDNVTVVLMLLQWH